MLPYVLLELIAKDATARGLRSGELHRLKAAALAVEESGAHLDENHPRRHFRLPHFGHARRVSPPNAQLG